MVRSSSSLHSSQSTEILEVVSGIKSQLLAPLLWLCPQGLSGYIFGREWQAVITDSHATNSANNSNEAKRH